MPKTEQNGGAARKVELGQLNREYLEIRNRHQAAKTFLAEALAAKQRGELISKRLAKLEVSFILNSFRQRVMVEPAQVASKLVAAGFCEEVNRHAAQELIRSALYAMLPELAAIPDKLTGADLIDDQVEVKEAQTPGDYKAKEVKAQILRQKKTETMRRLRAEGRTA